MNTRTTVLTIGVIALVIYLFPIGFRPLSVPDEYRYAEIPREMIDTGNWVAPYLTGLRYFEKPVLGYWMTGLSMVILGDNPFAHRLPVALSALGASLLLVWLVRSRREGAKAEILSAVVFLTAIMVFGVGTFNVLDTQFSFFVTGAMVMFYLAYESASGRGRAFYLALMGAFCGLAFLTKGFVVFGVVAVAIGPFMLWERRARELLYLPWIPILTAALMALPWSLAIHAREPDYWRHFFWVEHYERFTSGEADHLRPFWYLVPFFILGMTPWTALFPAAVAGLRRRGLHDPLLRYLICWCVVPFLMFSKSSGKLGTYILPCLAPAAVLVALGLLRYLRNEPPGKAFKWGAGVFGGILVIAASGFAANEAFNPFDQIAYSAAETGKIVAVAAGLLVWAGLSIFAARTATASRALIAFAAGPLLLMLVFPFVLPRSYEDRAAPYRELELLEEVVTEDALLVVGRSYVQAVAYALHRYDILMFRPGEFSYGLSYPEMRHRLLSEGNFDKVLEWIPPGKPVVVFMERRYYHRILASAGPPEREIMGNRIVIAVYRGR